MFLLRRFGTFLLLLGGSIGLLLSIDPNNADFGLVEYPAVKYSPYMLSLVVCGIFLLSSKIRFNFLGLSFLLFFIIAISGSLYSLLILDSKVEETYLGRSLGGFVFFAFLMLSQMPVELRWFLRRFLWGIVVFSISAVVVLILWRNGVLYSELSQMYQVKSTMIAATSLLGFYFYKSMIKKYVLFIAMNLAILLVAKTTSALVIVMACVYFFILNYNAIIQKYKVAKSSNYFFISLSFLISTTLVSYIFTSIIEERLETRGSGVRTELFLLRIQEFLDSPFIGNLFTGSPLLDFDVLHIPSHSDILDLLAMGGILSLFLFFIPTFLLVTKSIAASGDLGTLNSWFGFIVLVFLVVMFVNPILFLPGVSFVFWMALGLLASNRKIYLPRNRK